LNKKKKQNKNTRRKVGGWLWSSKQKLPRITEQQIKELNELIGENIEIKKQRRDLIYSLIATKILPQNQQNYLLQILSKYERAEKNQMRQPPEERQEYMRNASNNFNREFSIVMIQVKDSINKITNERKKQEENKEFSISNNLNSGNGGGPASRIENFSEERNSDITPSCFGGFCNNPFRESLTP